MKDEQVRQVVGRLTQDADFAVRVASLGKKPEDQLTLEQWPKVALSLPRLYAVVEAAEILVKTGLVPSLYHAILAMSSANSPTLLKGVADICARLAWQAQQPLIGQDRLARPIMGFTSGNLSKEEIRKDTSRIEITARFLLETLDAVYEKATGEDTNPS